MKSALNISLIFFFIFLFSGCSEINKQAAIEDLVGTYYGKFETTFLWSKLNIGIQDENIDNNKSESIEIRREGNDKAVIITDNTKIRLNNIDLASNGTVFNIPTQKIYISAKGPSKYVNIIGLQENNFGESRCDGVYDREQNRLSFSFEGIITIEVQNETFDLPILVRYYDFIKKVQL